MFAAGNNLISFVEEFAPRVRALPGDATGLQWGDLSREVPVLLLALDFSGEVLEEALLAGAPFIFTHHPFLYRPLHRLDLNNRHEALVVRALKEGVTLFSAHTDLDVAPRGVSHALGELLGLKNMQPLFPTGREELEKLVVFVPEGYEDKVRQAIAQAGAGWIGNYSHCTYQLLGTGTFLPREGSSPFLGTEGALEKVSEYRLETILFRRDREQVLEALFAAHPYEEVAYDLYPLSNEGQVWGLGRKGQLAEKVTLAELAGHCSKLLQPDFIKVLGDPEMKVEKVAVLGGSGSEYVENALQSGAQVFISGDIKFHDAQKAAYSGLALIDAGHDATERPVLPVLAGFLKERIKQSGFNTKVIISQKAGRLWRVPH
ncbi:MAG: Nif3-like dinuclear metal center hexameric protein [Dethiobacter sp.]|jgi:dinuclear metal center YbgI/SA1388 family protein|nr:MAG: Nif3-like dinuclear metal center hexameric protein [Dethiobacter sp.]